ncbi:MAG: hypothetical protein IT463_06115 [Planctomycetes bacterium]|nr:hypothetical protein [Planctomycetota bacterium]
MKRARTILAAGTLVFLAGCSSDGIVFNGQQQVDQFPIRKTPITHYKLPIENINPVTGVAEIDFTQWTSYSGGAGLMYTHFPERTSPGHDLWAMIMLGSCSDNPTCRTPSEVKDWPYTHDTYKAPGASWPQGPGRTLNKGTTASNLFLAGWVLSFQNQWFLRGIDGAALTAALPTDPPVRYESVEFASMAISIHETSAATGTYFSPLLSQTPPVSPQQEVGDPTTTGANGVLRIQVPANNAVSYGYNGNGAPAGLMAAGWREPPAQNLNIEYDLSTVLASSSAITLQGVPVPDYFGGGGPINAGGGVYMKRFSDNWQQTTSGQASTVSIDDGVLYSYYMAAIGNHVIGYGLGLMDSSFALPGVVNDQESIMNISVVFDMTAFIAAGKNFQFVVEDLLRMQDTVSGTWQAPGPNSTLPGKGR